MKFNYSVLQTTVSAFTTARTIMFPPLEETPQKKRCKQKSLRCS